MEWGGGGVAWGGWRGGGELYVCWLRVVLLHS